MPEFKTKANRLTRYALACGYIERAKCENDQGELWQATLLMEGSAIRIDTFTRTGGGSQRGSMPGGSMKTARQRFAHLIGAWGLKRIPNA